MTCFRPREPSSLLDVVPIGLLCDGNIELRDRLGEKIQEPTYDSGRHTAAVLSALIIFFSTSVLGFGQTFPAFDHCGNGFLFRDRLW